MPIRQWLKDHEVSAKEISNSKRQHDAQEYVTCLLGAIKPQLRGTTLRDRWDDLCCIMVREQFTCASAAKHIHEGSINPIYCLPLSIYNEKTFKNITSIDAVLDYMGEPSIKLTQRNCHYLGCKSKDATVKSVIVQYPEVLFLSLNRFYFNQVQQKTVKLKFPIAHTYVLNREGQVYDLVGALVHNGTAIQGGHYLSIVISPPFEQTKVAIECNDAHDIKYLDLDELDRYLKRAYIFAYQRREVTNPVPPPARSHQSEDEASGVNYPDTMKLCSYVSDTVTTDVTMGDYLKLKRNTWLNDVLVYFGLQHLWMTMLSQGQRRNVHIFTYIFNAVFTRDVSGHLLDQPPTEALALQMHAQVARHTRHVDLFDKPLVLWPIRDDDHWFLVVAVNLNSNNAILFTLNSYGRHGERVELLSHFKGYLNLEFTMKHPGLDPPHIHLGVTDPPQQTDGSSCGLFLLQYTETLFNRCCTFLISKQNLFLKLYSSPLRLDIICSDTSPLYDPLAIRQDWFSPTSPVNMRHQLAMTIQNLAAEQGLCINWPDLELN